MRHTLIARSLRFVRSLTVLVAFVLGAPSLMVGVAQVRFGGPAPWSAMTPVEEWRLGDGRALLTRPLSESVIADTAVRVGLGLGWLAIATFVVTLAAEAVHLVRHRGIACPDVRGLGVVQSVARMVASGLLVVVPVVDAPIRVAADAHVTLVPLPPVAALARSEPAPPSEPSAAGLPATKYVVEPGDSVFAIARRLVGDDAHDAAVYAGQLLDLNLGRRMADGQRFANAAFLEVGWELELPGEGIGVEAATVHLVERGESLWSIAHEQLGRGARWPEIFAANEGRRFDDGRRLTDPDLILPGWELDVPVGPDTDPGAAPETIDGAGPPVQYEPSGTRPASGNAVPDATMPTVASVPPGELAPAPDDAPSGSGEGVESGPSRTDLGRSSAGSTGSVLEDRGLVREPPSVEPGHGPPATGPDNPPVNAWLDDVDAASIAGGELPPRSVRVPTDVVDPTTVEPGPGVRLLTYERATMLSAGMLTLLVVRRQNRMRRSRPSVLRSVPRPVAVATERSLRAVDRGERFARVDIAIRHATMPLVDGDQRVVAALSGADGHVELIASGPVSLPRPWDVLTEDRIRWRLPAHVATDSLAEAARSVAAPCPALVQVGCGLDGRDVYVDLEALETLEVGGSTADADAIVTAVASTLATSVLAEVTTLVGVGVSDHAFFDHRHHRLCGSANEAFEVAAAHLGSTATADRSTFELRARVTSGEAWEPAVVLCASSAGLVEPPSSRCGLAVVSAAPVHGPSFRLAPDGEAWSLMPLGVRLMPVGVSLDEVVRLADVVRSEAAPDDAAPLTADAGHDDVAPGAETPPWELVVRLIGPVSVESSARRPVEFERSKSKELVAWLATHRTRPSRGAARAALWELDVRDATFSNVVSEARRSLARCVEPPAGSEWVGRTMAEVLPLHDLVVTDLDLVRHALARARGKEAASALADLCGALGWIEGLPFEGTAYLWPDADGIVTDAVMTALALCDEIARLALELGDVELVFEASGRGLRVLPGHEDMIIARMRAHDQLGDRAGLRHEWESYVRAITADPWSDGEPSPRMLALRDELLAHFA